MDWQYIIAVTIVLSATVLTAVKLVRYFISPASKCNGCSSGCGGCSLEELKREIAAKK
jgi:hypothetical protein